MKVDDARRRIAARSERAIKYNGESDVRVLGIDLGTRRIGVALSDPAGAVAFPLSVLQCESRQETLAKLKEMVRSTSAEAVVIGMPRTLRGETGLAAEEAEDFARQLAEQIDVPVTTWDERMTTVVAERALIEAGMRRERRRENRDKIAATIMLQSYLDAQSRR